MAELAVIPKTEWPSPASSAGLQEGLVKYTSGGGDEMSSPAPSSHHPGTVTDPCSLQSLTVTVPGSDSARTGKPVKRPQIRSQMFVPSLLLI